MDTHQRYIGSDLCKPGCTACATIHPDDDSTGARLLRNEDTPEAREMWAHVDAAAARVPSWVGKQPQQARSLMHAGLASLATEQEERAAAAVVLPTGAAERKGVPLAAGVLDYFPAALMEVAKLSKVGNDQHNPGQPLHWAQDKSTDHADCIMRHLVDRGTLDTDGVRHSTKVAWRALALLQMELQAEGAPKARGAK